MWVIKSLKTDVTFVAEADTLNWCYKNENVKKFPSKEQAEAFIKYHNISEVEILHVGD